MKKIDNQIPISGHETEKKIVKMKCHAKNQTTMNIVVLNRF